jgi:DNA-directed RNA polymerase specialized sigma24 family protein
MERARSDQHLSRISTLWSAVTQAHQGPADAAGAARQLLLERYGGAAYLYLLAAVGDADAADDLFQELALRFLRGDFQRADPRRGRFRDYLKAALIHLVHDHRRARQRQPLPFGDAFEPARALDGPEEESTFLASWRAELLDRTWKALAAANPTYHAVLLLRIDNPDAPSAWLAERLSEQLGKPIDAAWVRKTLQRAHRKYARLLVEEVKASLAAPTPEAVRQELLELDLLKYCRSALAEGQ